jgi:hypothetical protein
MKKQLIIFLLFSIQLSAQSNDPNPHFPIVKISVPCTEEFINNYKGKWLIHDPALGPTSTNDYHDEVIKRLNQFQNLVYQTYPQPMGSDACWSGSFVKTSFADEIKYELGRKDEWEAHDIMKNTVYRLMYGVTLCGWDCNGEKQIMNGYPQTGGAGLGIKANILTILNGNFSEGPEWTIDNRPIKQKIPTIGNWKGYEVMSTVGPQYADAASSHIILISRDGMLPYIPITRKQYLDRAILFVTRFYDDGINKIRKANEALPAQIRTPREDLDNIIAVNTKSKNDALKKLRDELEKTTNDGLLNAPAIVRPDVLIQSEGPVFLSESQGGIMLATENPAYLRKNLPKYVPQFFIVEVSWSTKAWSKEFKNIIEEKFPLDKLKAMIDK